MHSVQTLRIYAVTGCFEIVSEASRRLPDALKARQKPDGSWRVTRFSDSQPAN